MPAPPEELESRIGYWFRDRTLLLRALTHKSLLAEEPGGAGDNEQLEFLGDSILGFLASDFVLQLAPAEREGPLSRLKAHLVSAARLYEVALAIQLGPHLRLGKGEEHSGGRQKRALLADAVEALLAAIYLDAGPARGIDCCRAFLGRFLWPTLPTLGAGAHGVPIDPKNALQELAQAHKLPMPRYALIGESGPEHDKRFTVEVRVGPAHSAASEGSSKKGASQKAAALLLERLRAELSPASSPPAAPPPHPPARDPA